MASYKQVTGGNIFMGKLAFGADLLEELTQVCIQNSIQLGRVEALGAVQKAQLGFYHQDTKTYEFETLDKPLEITNLVGNVSMKDGRPFVHAHVTLTDAAGRAYGGHLAPGTIVFACEFVMQALKGDTFERALDQETGLPLWDIPIVA